MNGTENSVIMFRNSISRRACLLLILSSCFVLIAKPSHAQQLSLEDAIDTQVDVWVDSAPLHLFIEQLAQMTGRIAEVQEGLAGKISGRFNGSMTDTLGAVHNQFPVLLYLDDKTLGIVDQDRLVSATIMTGEGVLDPAMASDLVVGLLPGNSIDVRAGEVLVRGHPSFVNRMASMLASAMREIERAEEDPSSPINDVATLAIDPSALQVHSDESGSEEDAEVPTVEQTTRKTYLWVTDIPGFDTF